MGFSKIIREKKKELIIISLCSIPIVLYFLTIFFVSPEKVYIADAADILSILSIVAVYVFLGKSKLRILIIVLIVAETIKHISDLAADICTLVEVKVPYDIFSSTLILNSYIQIITVVISLMLTIVLLIKSTGKIKSIVIIYIAYLIADLVRWLAHVFSLTYYIARAMSGVFIILSLVVAIWYGVYKAKPEGFIEEKQV